VTETVMLRQDAFDAPLAHRLVNQRMAMSGTTYVGRRYMGLYAWWPVAVHPAPRTALLISYASARPRARWWRSASSTDRRRGRLARRAAAVALAQDSPASNPLPTPRVHVHVEDGRFFLPDDSGPLRHRHGRAAAARVAGIASLYSRESSPWRARGCGRRRRHLLAARLPAGAARDARDRGAFCAVFEDCSLWSGYLLDWMLVGTRDARGR
jgi:hypothetical protein